DVHQFSDNAHAIPLLAHRAFQKRSHSKLLTDRFGFLFSVFEPEGRAATNNFEPADLSQSCDQFFRESIRKIFVLRITTFVKQRQHRDGFSRDSWSRLALLATP